MSEFTAGQSFDQLRQRATHEVINAAHEDIATIPHEDAIELNLWIAQYTGDTATYDRLEEEFLPDPGRVAVAVVVDYEPSDAKPYGKYIEALCTFPTTHRIQNAFRIAAQKLEAHSRAEAYMTLHQTLSHLGTNSDVDMMSLPTTDEVLAGAVSAANHHLEASASNDLFKSFSDNHAMKVLMYAGAVQSDPSYATRVADLYRKKDSFSDSFTFNVMDSLKLSDDPVFKNQLIDLALAQISENRLIDISVSLGLLPYLNETQSQTLLHTLVTAKHVYGSPIDDQYLLDAAEKHGWLKPRQLARRRKAIQKKIVEWDQHGYREAGMAQRADRLLALGYTGDQLLTDATYGTYRGESQPSLTDKQRFEAIRRIITYTEKGLVSDNPGIINQLRDEITNDKTRFETNCLLISRGDTTALTEATDYLLTQKPWKTKQPLIPTKPELGYGHDYSLVTYLAATRKTEA